MQHCLDGCIVSICCWSTAPLLYFPRSRTFSASVAWLMRSQILYSESWQQTYLRLIFQPSQPWAHRVRHQLTLVHPMKPYQARLCPCQMDWGIPQSPLLCSPHTFPYNTAPLVFVSLWLSIFLSGSMSTISRAKHILCSSMRRSYHLS